MQGYIKLQELKQIWKKLKIAVLIVYFVSVWRQKVVSPIQPICLKMKMPFRSQTSSPRPKSALWVELLASNDYTVLNWHCWLTFLFIFFLFHSEKKQTTSALAKSRHFRMAWSRQETVCCTFCGFVSLTEWRMVAGCASDLSSVL